MFTPDSASSGQPLALDIRKLSKRFHGKWAIENLALAVKPGDICGLAGANGGGKSTTMRLLAGLLPPDAGEGSVLGCDLLRASHHIRRKVGYLAQRSTLYATISVLENLRFRASIFGLPGAAGIALKQLRAFGLDEFKSTPVNELSGGWLRQVQLAATLIHRPQLLLLDEPTVGLDPAARHAIWRTLTLLASEGVAIVLCTHDFSEAARCSDILLLSRGQVCARGTPEEVLRECRAAALVVSGPRVLGLSALLRGPLVLAADPVGAQLRLLVALEHLTVVKSLLKSRGFDSVGGALTLEDAALAVARRARTSNHGDRL
jgi:ABC-2 type transport system ATP-binding protein